jgi:hypothetical protein
MTSPELIRLHQRLPFGGLPKLVGIICRNESRFIITVLLGIVFSVGQAIIIQPVLQDMAPMQQFLALII